MKYKYKYKYKYKKKNTATAEVCCPKTILVYFKTEAKTATPMGLEFCSTHGFPTHGQFS